MQCSLNNGPRGIVCDAMLYLQYPREAFVSPVYDEKYNRVQTDPFFTLRLVVKQIYCAPLTTSFGFVVS